MNQKIIVYHSQTEQNTDEFIQMLFGWLVTHPWMVLIIAIPIIFLLIAINSKKRY